MSIYRINIFLFLFILSLSARAQNSTFAIVIDEAHKQALQTELELYKKSIEKDGLNVITISEKTLHPETIRHQLHQHYKNNKLEGAVFIGNVPIPMIRDAQHLTSTFKMPQDMDWIESSVPSDRFYDDFDLKFSFIKQDDSLKNLYYYKLLPESKHHLQMDIYSGRIKAPTSHFEESVKYISRYLKKVVDQKEKHNVLDNILAFTAEGYNSNALNSWLSVVLAYRTQFADLYKSPGVIKFMNYRNKDMVKPVLLSALGNPNLDFAYLNGHGLPDEQILSGNPEVSNPQPSMENVSRYLRSQIRKAAPEKREERKQSLQKSLGLNDKWFENIFDTEIELQDSLFDAQKIISISDLKNTRINAKVAYLDACLTGSFQFNDYLAAYYPFNLGENVVSIANSVGVLQDLWGNQLAGLLQYGVRVGQILKHTAYLETHIFGDPTFHFSHSESADFNQNIAHNTQVKYWKKYLKSDSPDKTALALQKIAQFDTRENALKILRDAFYKSSFETVRTEAFLELKKLQPNDWNEILISASKDNFEFLRRLSTYQMGESGNPVFIQPLVDLYLGDRSSNRTAFNVERFILFFEKEAVLKAIEQTNVSDTEYKEEFKGKVAKESFFDKAYLELNKNEVKGERIPLAVTVARAYSFHQYIPQLLEFTEKNLQNEKQSTTALEALSWFKQSVRNQEIQQFCIKIINSSAATENVKHQANRTLNILKDKES